MLDLDSLPLCTNKTQWEARSQGEWETEKAFYNISPPVLTFGELLNARRNSNDPLNAQTLQSWEAGADKMGLMMNIATAFI